VVCDLTMPKMNGWDTLAGLRAIAPAVPVVLASGHDEASVMAGDHTAWPSAFLGKPYVMAQLGDALAQAVATEDARAATR
jgi:FixJ family two-component response regulator